MQHMSMRQWLLGVMLLGSSAIGLAADLDVIVTDDAGRPVPEAVVYLTSSAASAAVKPLQNAKISQKNKMFTPDVLVVTKDTAVHFPNEDTVRHHVYSFSPVKKFEIKLYVGTPAKPVVFDQPGVVVLGCNIHDHMVAWVVVLDTPYYTLTDPDGGATLLSIPPGNYQLNVWHKGLPVGAQELTQSVTITTTSASLDLALPNVNLP